MIDRELLGLKMADSEVSSPLTGLSVAIPPLGFSVSGFQKRGFQLWAMLAAILILRRENESCEHARHGSPLVFCFRAHKRAEIAREEASGAVSCHNGREMNLFMWFVVVN